jgi:murein DD-endopeptidase MepM/ murein hydrolase activator NlpD
MDKLNLRLLLGGQILIIIVLSGLVILFSPKSDEKPTIIENEIVVSEPITLETPSFDTYDYERITEFEYQSPVLDESCTGVEEVRGFLSYHNGIDYVANEGCIISSVESGVVEFAGWIDDGSGYTVIINHGDGIVSKLLHGNGEFIVSEGDLVQKGEKVMGIGCTGLCTGTHVHVTIEKNGIATDPNNPSRLYSL